MNYPYLFGSIDDELDFTMRDFFQEKCGLVGAIGIPTASCYVLDGLIGLEPRGERGAGIITDNDGKPHQRRRVGPVSVQFREYDNVLCAEELPGSMAIGHCRYATKGDPDSPENVQPFLFHMPFGDMAIGHNGTLVAIEQARADLKKQGAVFTTTTDTEVFAHLISRSDGDNLEKRILAALAEIKAAYSFLIMAGGKIYAIRDRYGVRPLSMAYLKGGYIIASETFPFDQMDARYWRDVEPGEMVVFESGCQYHSVRYAEAESRLCVFEPVYFMHPRSRINGVYVEDFRRHLGLAMAARIKDKARSEGADCVVPIMDSGEYFARGLADGLGLPYVEAFFRTRNPRGGNQNRSFTATTTEERRMAIRRKLHLRPDLIAGKNPIFADDSIVRANTCEVITGISRQAGVAKVFYASGFAPIVNPCHNGMDFQSVSQLVAVGKSIPQIKEKIGVDWLFYLYPDILEKVTKKLLNCGVCGACYSGNYPA